MPSNNKKLETTLVAKRKQLDQQEALVQAARLRHLCLLEAVKSAGATVQSLNLLLHPTLTATQAARLAALREQVDQLLAAVRLPQQAEYTLQLVQAIAADPGRVQRLAEMTSAQLLQHYAWEVLPQMALLMPRYSAEQPPDRTGPSEQQQLDALVDEAVGTAQAWLLLGSPRRLIPQLLLCNLKTMVDEAAGYPSRWWRHVAEVMALSDDQRAVLTVSWRRMVASGAALLQQHEQLAGELALLRAQQQAKLAGFGQQAAAVFKAVHKQNRHPSRQAQQDISSGASTGARDDTAWATTGSNAPAAAGAARPVPAAARAPSAASFAALVPSNVRGGGGQPLERAAVLHTDAGALLPFTQAQRQLEEQMAALRQQLGQLHLLQTSLLHNLASKEQLARCFLNSWPYYPDAAAVCEALASEDGHSSTAFSSETFELGSVGFKPCMSVLPVKLAVSQLRPDCKHNEISPLMQILCGMSSKC